MKTGSRTWLEWRADARARAEVGGGSGRAAEAAEGTGGVEGAEGAEPAAAAAAAAAAALVLLLLCRASGEPPRDIGGEESVAPLCRLPPPRSAPCGLQGRLPVAADGDGSAPAAPAPMRRPGVEPPRTAGSNPSRAAPPTPAPPTPRSESGAARPELGTPDAVASYCPMLPRSRRALPGEGGGGWDSASSVDSAGSSAADAARGCRRRALRPRCRACSREAAPSSSGPASSAPAPRAPASRAPASSACSTSASAAPHLPAPAPLPLAAPVPNAPPPAAPPLTAPPLTVPKPAMPPSAAPLPAPPLPAPPLPAPPLPAPPLPAVPLPAAPPAFAPPAATLAAGVDTLRACGALLFPGELCRPLFAGDPPRLRRVTRPRCRACIIVAAASSASAIPCNSCCCRNSSSSSAALEHAAPVAAPSLTPASSSAALEHTAPVAAPSLNPTSSTAALECAAPVAAPAGVGVAGMWLPKALLDGTSVAGSLVLVCCRTSLPRWMACTLEAASASLGRCSPKATVGRFNGGEPPAAPAVLAPLRQSSPPSPRRLPATPGCHSVASKAPAPISRRAESAETVPSPAPLCCLEVGAGVRAQGWGWGWG